MPSYQDALSAHPSAFLAYASEMTAAAADLATQQTDYGTKVAEINGHWRDKANDAFNGDVGTVNAHLTQVIGEVTATASGLAGTGATMLLECTALKAADAALKAIGFDIQPAPLVTLGAAQRTAIAMAGPFGPVLEAALQAQAAAGTMGLQTLTSLINAADATAGAALGQAADLLKPLDDKSTGGKDMERLKAADDHSSSGTEANEEESSGEEKEEEEDKQEEEQAEKEPQEEQTQPQGEQPSMPEHPVEDMAQPEMPEMSEMDSPWGASELEDPDDLAGGLASGGSGLGGGGVGGGGLSSGLPAGGAPTGGGMGTGTIGAPVATAATAVGAKPGAGSGMMGAGGGRGAGGADQDNEVERESFLTEDPEEDVWGIAKDEETYS